ncbi:Hsp20/alpha crystallin family protein [Fulvivirgaceae bacterium PWU4]|uniref:Hsp20/alpha crystallin family protein n=1 Tax=Chryseosolibacter histidini TaxID=2782349 RepID=A0AAP2DHY4_9BACT|nr:Hsp20/alpha crystallin family protein [Chryseosolibacter histidini]MBT1696723.1 Hsp20/alpha crystallin family protein [Chryseosolibacter histidini]
MKVRRDKAKNDGRNRWIENSFNLPGMFDDFVTRDLFRPSFSSTGVSTPAVNVIETNDDFRLEMVAPGMKKENFHLELQDNVLTISYDHEDNREGARRDWKYITREYNYHSFSRSFSLPETIESEKIQAKYEDGILHVIIPKKDDAKGKRSRQINIT